MASPVAGVRDWLHERFDIEGIKALAQKKKVPIHRYSYWYFLGGMTLFLFGVQVLTGALLLMYYRPGADEAFESVQLIMTQVQFGWLDPVDSLVVGQSADLHGIRASVQRAVLEVVSQATRADLGERHTAALPDAVFRVQRLPAAMEHAVVLRDQGRYRDSGADSDHRPSDAALPARWRRDHGSTLTRMFGFHVAILPAIVTFLICMHLALIQWFGMSLPPRVEAEWASRSRSEKGDPILPQLRVAGVDGFVCRAGSAGRAGGIVSVGPGRKGRSVWLRASWHQAGVVLPVHVPDAQADSLKSIFHGWRSPGCAGFWSGGSGVAAAAFY